MKPMIVITMGDPGGIGPEIILKTLREINLSKAILLVIGSRNVFQFAESKIKIHLEFHQISEMSENAFSDKKINFFDVETKADEIYSKVFQCARPADESVSYGNLGRWNAALTYATLETAARYAKEGLISGIVTAPINKEAMRMLDPGFVGHTEFFAQTAGVKNFAMMFVSERLRVTLATIHVPLKEVSNRLNTDTIRSRILLTDEFLKRRIGIPNPKIGVAALNPHGREFGREEDEIILPAIEQARNAGADAIGPMPGDQIFNQAYAGKLDAVIAMYHDQGLAPFKMIAFHDGVNTTLGLPYLRTSPDHGTAFDIAYQNKADHSSFKQSFEYMEAWLSK
ncbi:MAG: 4-hydroxythreonine-4-phosphate dehydrogenase PdxA [Omnitrophica bacterium RIFCSPLOWO2_12_FULL_44_17]|uniref:4-hydroxythreonine-4-phosphate dehydrogenase PdxA n=1 Tax=Candidatus Danuiimicrobium aquiferis TaxID=1801832 RepID=A0A1G1KSP8_9BACT|nr:MAG: 4-hydroxythreonine-4-phosphate dehydrogenase PdxA [Omnitrophica bacterium RIFCSPHIGHO2_02_FULL_45_28]OGW89852.1 MAG: 4-hydroxythreonine-4-phosphate dehydrogenase PdxA [Omnitrophica bacterium RIFCSPHIGHO2_12_FULL_44_12]OGW95927.1 MAG: 4-hydroxythreonine-4-phosphate dehydrogenase PdxA [Omnitrophica bacterium RIFCSPLOWO2_12_FULL_44_17]OGX01926.1 MAG: 4-hydroxythreonine-4-phosphate dehydrogenase PdxA [Omnitrophica bacterium RIFCSPLOWO2_02_FULL_44_11]